MVHSMYACEVWISLQQTTYLEPSLLIEVHIIAAEYGCTVVDGSGMVTGLAFHKLQQELAVLTAGKEENQLRATRAVESMKQLREAAHKER